MQTLKIDLYDKFVAREWSVGLGRYRTIEPPGASMLPDIWVTICTTIGNFVIYSMCFWL